MLLITRRTGESIVINGSIEVKVVDVKGGRVKLGFEYPEGNTVYRQELYDKIMTENRSAASASADHLGDLINTLPKNTKNKAKQDTQTDDTTTD